MPRGQACPRPATRENLSCVCPCLSFCQRRPVGKFKVGARQKSRHVHRMFCAFKAVIKQSSLQTWQHASPFAMRSLCMTVLHMISAELGMSPCLAGCPPNCSPAHFQEDARSMYIAMLNTIRQVPLVVSCTIGSRSSLRFDSGANSDRRSF